VYRVRFPGDGGAVPPQDARLTPAGRGLMPTPWVLRERARRAGLPMPAALPVLGGTPGADGRGVLVLASPLGLHALRVADGAGRLTGDVVLALDGPALRPATVVVEGQRVGAGTRRPVVP
jgi:hypothetical protein